jgi:hypothetical protein
MGYSIHNHVTPNLAVSCAKIFKNLLVGLAYSLMQINIREWSTAYRSGVFDPSTEQVQWLKPAKYP